MMPNQRHQFANILTVMWSYSMEIPNRGLIS